MSRDAADPRHRVLPVGRDSVLWAGLGSLVVVGALVVALGGTGDGGLDLGVYRSAVQDALAGQPLYDRSLAEGDGFPFTYPPSAVLVLAPLALLPLPAMQVVWLLMSAALVVVGVRIVLRALGRGSADDVATWRTAAWVLATWGVLFGLVLGQVGALLLALCAVDLLAPGRRRLVGAGIGVAAAIKLTPAVFVLWLLLARRFRDAAVAAAVFALLTLAAWVALPDDSWDYWAGRVVVDISRNVTLQAAGNQSVPAWVDRLVGGADPSLLLAASSATLVVLLGAALLLRSSAPVSAVAVVGVASAAVPPIGWTHLWIWLPLLAVAVWHECRDTVARAIAVAAGVVATVPLAAPLVVAADAPPWVRIVSGAYVIATCALVAGVLAVRVRPAVPSAS
ncbi:MAG: DUF2029 domain-containing protein [Actinobacteria bacterium]|nr:DUF2029 domain-containing protein [Actinomycetota bacterium]